jgi:hypothetical protein
MSDARKETVIIVHGTWSAPIPGTIQWYELGGAAANEQFVAKLNANLEKRGSPARCWAHCTETESAFCWSGQNDWTDRTQAAARLADTIDRLQQEGWRVHVVAHSHGGNVAVEALPQLKSMPTSATGLSGTVTTLGTPFIDAATPIAKRLDARRRVDDILAWGAYLLLSALVLLVTASLIDFGAREGSSYIKFVTRSSVWPWLSIPVGLLAIGLYSIVHSRRRLGWTTYWNQLSKSPPARAFMLVLGSSMDEAWQLLHHLSRMKSPIEPESGWWKYMWRSRREYLRKSRDVEHINGAALFHLQPPLVKIVAAVFQFILLLTLFGLLVSATPSQLAADFDAFLVDKKIADQDFHNKYSNLQSDKDQEDAVAAGVKKLTAAQVDQWLMYRVERNVERKRYLIIGFATLILFWFLMVSTATFFFGRSFYSVLWAPARWIRRHVRAIAGIPGYTATYIVRKDGWTFLQQLAMGLEGFPARLPPIDKIPAYVPSSCYRYEDMPKDAEQRALAARSTWVDRHFGDVAEMFAKLLVTTSDLSNLVKLIEADDSLVHGAYYKDDACIARIADWIAGREAEIRPANAQYTSAAHPANLATA